MKTTKIMKWMMLSFLLLFPLVGAIAQVIDPPTDVVDLVVNFNTLIGSTAGYVAISLFLTGLINGWLKLVKPWIKQLVSWLVPIVLVIFVSLVFKTGFLAGKPILTVIAYGLGTGLVSNGVFDVVIVNTIVNWVVGKLGGLVKKE